MTAGARMRNLIAGEMPRKRMPQVSGLDSAITGRR